MNRELVLLEDYEPPLESRFTNRRKKPNQAKPIIIDLAKINTTGLYYNIRNKKNKFFTISLYEIDQILNYW
jgi:hypothetical protein